MRSLQVCLDRFAYVELLAEDAVRKRDIVEAIGKSRSTVDRDVRVLESHGLVERTSEGYRTTAAGQLLYEDLRRLRERAEVALEAREVFDALPEDAPLDPDCLVDAEVIRPEPHVPDRPLRAFLDTMADADRLRVFSPVVVGEYVREFTATVLDGAQAEVVLTSEVVGRLVSAYADELESCIETGRYVLYEIDSVPYHLALIDHDDETTVVLVVHSEHGIRGVIRSTAVPAVSWAERRFEAYRDEATRRTFE